MSLWFIPLSHTLSHFTYAALRCYINSDEALPWGLVAPEASKIIPCSRRSAKQMEDEEEEKEKSYQSLEGLRRDLQLQQRLLAVEQLARCVAG